MQKNARTGWLVAGVLVVGAAIAWALLWPAKSPVYRFDLTFSSSCAEGVCYDPTSEPLKTNGNVDHLSVPKANANAPRKITWRADRAFKIEIVVDEPAGARFGSETGRWEDAKQTGSTGKYSYTLHLTASNVPAIESVEGHYSIKSGTVATDPIIIVDR